MTKPRITWRNLIFQKGKVNCVEASFLIRQGRINARVPVCARSIRVCICVHLCVFDRVAGGRKIRRVTGVNQKESPSCKRESVAVVS